MFVISLIIAGAYLPGTSGSWLFDDFPNIVDNKAVQPGDASIASLTAAALSSPSSDAKRPLASLSFAVNFLVSGLDPQAMKVTNVVIHLLNGWAAFLLMRLILAGPIRSPTRRDGRHAAIIAFLWLALPINLTAVLYVVQRMESLSNLFVLLGLLGYVAGRRRMLSGRPGFLLAGGSVVAGTVFGLLAKETAVLTPLYAVLLESLIFRWQGSYTQGRVVSRRTIGLFVVILLLPFLAGGAIVFPHLLADATWASRTFTMHERLLSECRVVALYLRWTLFPTPSGLSFYHDDFVISTGWLTPWTTLASAALLAAIAVLGVLCRRRWPLFALGIAWYFACHVLTATIIPLELIYEHRNYFASLGVVLAVVTALRGIAEPTRGPSHSHVRPRDILLIVAGIAWLGLTALTANRWGGGPTSLPEELAHRAPASPRAQYELGRTYVIMTGYKPDSPYIKPAETVLERAAAIPGSSTLPEQALIFFTSRMHLPVKPAWWSSMLTKLANAPVSIEDESAIISLASCKVGGDCDFDVQPLLDVYMAALSQGKPHARLLGSYSDFAWSALGDKQLGYDMAKAASDAEPSEPVYHITVFKQALALGDIPTAKAHLAALERLNIGGRLGASLTTFRAQLASATSSEAEPQ
jgi:hypothetical protein